MLSPLFPTPGRRKREPAHDEGGDEAEDEIDSGCGRCRVFVQVWRSPHCMPVGCGELRLHAAACMRSTMWHAGGDEGMQFHPLLFRFVAFRMRHPVFFVLLW